jgi:hypothetical protein
MIVNQQLKLFALQAVNEVTLLIDDQHRRLYEFGVDSQNVDFLPRRSLVLGANNRCVSRKAKQTTNEPGADELFE